MPCYFLSLMTTAPAMTATTDTRIMVRSVTSIFTVTGSGVFTDTSKFVGII